MPTFSTRRNVPFSPEQMFALVADVEKYPEFLPLCEALMVRQRTTDSAGRPVLLADMTAGYKAVRESFISRVTLDEGAQSILVEYIDGPFSYLENRWKFKAADGGCDVHFDIAYAFKSRMLGLLVGALFDKAFRKFAAAFEERARAVYGTGADESGRYTVLTDPATP